MISLLESGMGNDCLTNCSSQGKCVFSSTEKTPPSLACKCNENHGGVACQLDIRPFSSSPCINNGTCVDHSETRSFRCECQEEFYYGAFCEMKRDLCHNVTCSRNGYCLQTANNVPTCVCNYLYSVVDCEIQSTKGKVIQSWVTLSSIIAIACILAFYLIIVAFDMDKMARTLTKQKQYRQPNARQKSKRSKEIQIRSLISA
jgi:hypothetical protein